MRGIIENEWLKMSEDIGQWTSWNKSVKPKFVIKVFQKWIILPIIDLILFPYDSWLIEMEKLTFVLTSSLMTSQTPKKI